MPLLAGLFGLLGSAFSNLFVYFLAMFGRKFTVSTASVLAFITATIALIFCMKTILLGVTALIVIPSWIYTFIAWFIPSNFIAVVSSILSGKICKEAYNMMTTKIDLKFFHLKRKMQDSKK